MNTLEKRRWDDDEQKIQRRLEWHHVCHSCGHTRRYRDLPEGHAEKRLKFFATFVCDECLIAEIRSAINTSIEERKTRGSVYVTRWVPEIRGDVDTGTRYWNMQDLAEYLHVEIVNMLLSIGIREYSIDEKRVKGELRYVVSWTTIFERFNHAWISGTELESDISALIREKQEGVATLTDCPGARYVSARDVFDAEPFRDALIHAIRTLYIDYVLRKYSADTDMLCDFDPIENVFRITPRTKKGAVLVEFDGKNLQYAETTVPWLCLDTRTQHVYILPLSGHDSPTVHVQSIADVAGQTCVYTSYYPNVYTWKLPRTLPAENMRERLERIRAHAEVVCGDFPTDEKRFALHKIERICRAARRKSEELEKKRIREEEYRKEHPENNPRRRSRRSTEGRDE